MAILQKKGFSFLFCESFLCSGGFGLGFLEF